MKIIITISLFILLPLFSYAQKQLKLSGFIKNLTTNEVLIGATIYSKTSKKGTQTDENGKFSFVLIAGKHDLVISFIGYQNLKQTIDIQSDTEIDFDLKVESVELLEVEVTGQSATEKVESVQMSTNTLTAKEAKLLPALFGETDLIKILQLKPGVQSGGEGGSGLYIRGGGADQNLVLLDGALIYNPNHLFGFFSVFNSDAVDRVDLYKGDFPAQFGGRLSSVVDVKLRSADATKLKGTGGLGLISSRLALEFPIYFKRKTDRNNKLNVILSARRTYFDVFTRVINRSNEGVKNYDPIPSYYFHDLTAKLSYQISKKDKIYFSGYLGRDAFEFQQRFNVNLEWGNTMGILGWQRQFSPKLTMNTAIINSAYSYEIRNKFDDFSFKIGSGIWDISLKSDWTYKASDKHFLTFGGIVTNHEFSLGQFAGGNGADLNINRGTILPATEFGVFISDEFTMTNRLTVQAGLRYSGFNSTINSKNNFYAGFEPRISARYKVNDKISVKGSFSQMYQYQHLVSSSGASLPSDVWYPSTALAKPEKSWQAATGISFALFGDKIFLSNEVYYKSMTNQIDFKDGSQLFARADLDGEFVFGDGWAYGNEIYIEKKRGKTTGWIGFTHAYAWRQYDAINGGKPFNPRYDRRNDISVVIMHKLSQHVFISATWVYGTGNAISLPVGRFYLQDFPNRPPLVIPEYGDRNSFRMADYHRMDIGLVWKFKPKWGESDLTFSIYNLYNRRNAFFLYFEQKNNDTTKLPEGFVAKQVSLFPIIPSITYNFKF